MWEKIVTAADIMPNILMDYACDLCNVQTFVSKHIQI